MAPFARCMRFYALVASRRGLLALSVVPLLRNESETLLLFDDRGVGNAFPPVAIAPPFVGQAVPDDFDPFSLNSSR